MFHVYISYVDILCIEFIRKIKDKLQKHISIH